MVKEVTLEALKPIELELSQSRLSLLQLNSYLYRPPPIACSSGMYMLRDNGLEPLQFRFVNMII